MKRKQGTPFVKVLGRICGTIFGAILRRFLGGMRERVVKGNSEIIPEKKIVDKIHEKKNEKIKGKSKLILTRNRGRVL